MFYFLNSGFTSSSYCDRRRCLREAREYAMKHGCVVLVKDGAGSLLKAFYSNGRS